MGFIGKVKSSLEYEFATNEMSDNFIKLKESKYHSISTDASIEEIRDVLICKGPLNTQTEITDKNCNFRNEKT